MQRIHSFAVTAAASVLFLAAPAPAFLEGESDPTLEELGEEFDRMAIEFQVQGAKIVGFSKRPPGDPDLSPEAFREAVTAAPRLSPAQALERTKKVRLRLLTTEPARSALAGLDSQWRPLIESLNARGVETASEADAVIELLINMQVNGFGTTAARDDGQIHMIDCIAEFGLPARVLRGNRPHHTEVVVVHGRTMRVGYGTPTEAQVVAAVDATIAELFAKAQAISAREVQDPRAWPAWVADPAQAATRHAAFRASFAEDADAFDPGLADLPGFSGLWSGYARPSTEIGRPYTEESATLRQYWNQRLAASGVGVAVVEGPLFNHYVWAERIQGSGRMDGTIGWSSRASIYDSDCLAVQNGELVRVRGDSYVDDTEYGLNSARQLDARIENGMRAQIDRFAAAIAASQSSTPGGAGPARPHHPHTQAVVNYLKTRQLLELPDYLRDDIANRIAMGLAAAEGIPQEYRDQWLIERDGEPYFNLWRVGYQRGAELVPQSVKDSIDGAIADLDLSDPMGIAAFDQIWWDAAHRRPAFPDGYAERLAGTRPSGSGALSIAKIRTAYEIAGTLARHHVPKPERGAVFRQLDSMREALQKQHVLVAEYLLLENGLRLTTDRYFLYGDALPEFEALCAQLPEELKMSRIWRNVEHAPYRLEEAEQLAGR